MHEELAPRLISKRRLALRLFELQEVTTGSKLRLGWQLNLG